MYWTRYPQLHKQIGKQKMLARNTVEHTLGKTFADYLDELIIDVGPKLNFTRREMIDKLGCPNTIAAARLSKVLKKHGIDSGAKLWATPPTDLLRIRKVGMTMIYVAMCILDYLHYSVEEWWGWNDNVVKFSAYKEQALKRAKKRAS